MSGRGARVPRPAAGGQWTLRFARRDAAERWEEACNQWAENVARAYDLLSDQPRTRTDRNHRLKGTLGTAKHKGRELEQWQHELTSGARIWFLVDDQAHVVWVQAVHLGHPKRTE